MSRAPRRGYRHPMRAGILTVIALVAVTFYGFSKDNPFHRPFHLNVVVENSAGLKRGSIVRVAGIDVGKVSSIERYNGAEAALVKMDLNDTGLPVRAGAQVRIRPRLFLEGNFVMELSPGAPGSKRLEDGDTIPITQTSRSAQLDEVFSTLQGPEREDLQVLVKAVGKALDDPDPADTNSLTKGESAGESLNDTFKAAGGAGRDIEDFVRSLQGQDRSDLAAAVRSLADSTGPLADNADELGTLIDGLDRTVSVFAENSAAVREGIGELPETVRSAQTNLPVIRRALPPIRRVSGNIADAADNIPVLVKASDPFLEQTDQLLSDEEAGGLVKELEPISSGLADVAPNLAATLSDLDRISICTTDVLAPTANSVITNDGAYNTGLSVWDETLRGLTGLASSVQSYDGNGAFGRAASTQGFPVLSGPRQRVSSSSTTTPSVGTANSAPVNTRPAKPAKTAMTTKGAPWNFKQPCSAKSRPDLNAVPTGPADGSAGLR